VISNRCRWVLSPLCLRSNPSACGCAWPVCIFVARYWSRRTPLPPPMTGDVFPLPLRPDTNESRAQVGHPISSSYKPSLTFLVSFSSCGPMPNHRQPPGDHRLSWMLDDIIEISTLPWRPLTTTSPVGFGVAVGVPCRGGAHEAPTGAPRPPASCWWARHPTVTVPRACSPCAGPTHGPWKVAMLGRLAAPVGFVPLFAVLTGLLWAWNVLKLIEIWRNLGKIWNHSC
jgi:hypothetical protein